MISTGFYIQKIITKSIGYIALISVLLVMSFVIVLDVLKYFFHIDPVGQDSRLNREAMRQKQKKRSPPTVVRYIYVH